jgi:hypothetical protein
MTVSRRTALTAIAALPATTTAALAGADPTYEAIEKHKAAGTVWSAAVDIRSNFPDLDITEEQREQLDQLDEAVDDAWELLEEAGIDLINTQPTTRAGIVAAIQYLREQMRDDGTYMPQTFKLDTGGDAKNTMGWIHAYLDTIADAAIEANA